MPDLIKIDIAIDPDASGSTGFHVKRSSYTGRDRVVSVWFVNTVRNVTSSSSDGSDGRRATDPNHRRSGRPSAVPILRTIGHAHPESQAAMEELVGRYHDAVTRYIHLKVRDKHLADEVLQEFWTKLLTGKLAGADKSKGRFRDYLRTVLHRLIIDHFRTRKLQPLPPGDLLDAARPDEDFDRVWREAVINRVWSRLETYQASTPKNRYATVLQLQARLSQSLDRRDRREARRDDPNATSRPRHSARTSSVLGPSSSSSSSRSCEKPSTRPAPKTSRRKSLTSAWDTSIAATAARPRAERVTATISVE